MTTSCNRLINLIDVFPDWLTGEGIFAIMEQTVELPWSEIIDGASLDVEYFGNRSGSKPVAPLVYKLLDDSGELSAENRSKLVGAIWNQYGRNWTALYNTTIAEYNPLDNYNMTEQDTEHGNNSTTYGKTVAETVEREGINHTSVSNDNTVNRKHFGFNAGSAAPVDTDSSEGSTAGSGDETVTEDRNIKDGGMDATTTTNNKTITRKGNIGVTTSQQLLQSERELWFWNFIDNVFSDVDTMLTLAVFDQSERIQIFKRGSTDYLIPVASPSVLGGVQPDAKTPNMTQPVGVDSEGGLWSQIPLATPFVRGGVQPTAQTAEMTQPVGVDGAGRLWVQIPEAEEYILPVATSSVLGGVQPNAKTSAMTQPVGVDSSGALWTMESPGISVASPTVLGGVQPTAKTSAMTTPVGVDTAGRLWVRIPTASSSRFGTVKPLSKTENMTQPVGVDGEGRLWADASVIPNSFDIFLTIREDGSANIIFSWIDGNIYEYVTGYDPNYDFSARFYFVSPVRPLVMEANIYAGTIVDVNGGGELFVVINRYNGSELVDQTPMVALSETYSGLSTALFTDGASFDSYGVFIDGITGELQDITAGVTSTFIHLTFYF